MDKPAQPDSKIQGNVAMHPLPPGKLETPLGMLMQDNIIEKHTVAYFARISDKTCFYHTLFTLHFYVYCNFLLC